MESTTDKTVANLQGAVIAASTAAGAAYVKKITHPPTTIPGDYSGTPDGSSPNVVLMETKGETNFPPILTVPSSATTVTTLNSNKMLFIQPSGGKVASYCFLWNDANIGGIGTGWSQPYSEGGDPSVSRPAFSNICPPCINNAGYNWDNWSADISQFRTAYKSQTFYLNATDFNNQGTVATAKFKPNIIRTTVKNLLKQHQYSKKSQDSLLSALAKIIKCKKSKADEYDLADYPFDYDVQCLDVDAVDALINKNPFDGPVIFSGVIADTTSDVMNMSSKAATTPAKDGAFIVHQKVGPISEWITTGDQLRADVSSAYGGPIISFIRNRVPGEADHLYIPLVSNPNTFVSAAANNSLDVPWNNLDWAVTIFEGLTIPSTVGTSLSSVPYVTVKSFNGHEMQPQFYSSIRPFSRLLPPVDTKAMEIASTIFHGRPDSLPASANDLASIAATAVQFLPTVVGFLKNLFGGKKDNEKAMVKVREFVKPKQQAPKKQPKQNKQLPNNPDKASLRRLEGQMSQLLANTSKQGSTLPSYKSQPYVSPRKGKAKARKIGKQMPIPPPGQFR